MAVRLQHKLHEIAVQPGTFLIGRGADCQLALDDPLVSRRHAAIRVAADESAVLEDLGSRNGVFLNGVRVEKVEPLRDGDMVRIGSQDICFTCLTESGLPVGSARALRVTMQQIPTGEVEAALRAFEQPTADAAPAPASAPISSPISPPISAPIPAPASRPEAAPASAPASAPISRPADSGPSSRPKGLPASLPTPAIRDLRPLDPDEPDETTTIAGAGFGLRGASGGLSIIGSVADKALALGRVEEAERILARALGDVQSRAGKGEIDAETAERAASYAVRLAAATGRGVWIDYVFLLYKGLRALPPARLVDELYAAVRRVKHTDKNVLRAYTACLKEISSSFGPAERFVQQRVEGFERFAP
jgi:hypothetical protein